jgi:nucleotide-binding universal stress UspA family protein
MAAALSALALLEGRLGRVTIAAVEPNDANAADAERAQQDLAATAAVVNERLRALGGPGGVTVPLAGTIVLHGRPADALRDRAEDGNYGLIAIGSHGHGLSSALLGSVAASLVARSPVPLLVAGRSTTVAVEAAAAPLAGAVGA